MAGFIFTHGITFGVSNGPTYQGSIVTPCNILGTENFRDYPALCLNSVTTVLDVLGFTLANLLAIGFAAFNSAVQTGTPTPAQLLAAAITIQLEDMIAGPGDFTVTLVAGLGQAWVIETADPTMIFDCTQISVVGDAVVDVEVMGLLALTA